LVKFVALILPLSLDTFAVCASLGIARLSRGDRLRLGALFAAFEGGMPLIGLVAGAALGKAIGGVADYVAIAALAGVGLYMLRSGGEAEEQRVELFARARGAAILGLGLSVSLDELAIGFTIGLLGVPLIPAIVFIAIQAFAVSQLGLALGGRVAENVRDNAERLAGVVLVALAAVLIASRLMGFSF
jgi:manganese efflux pump family protein